MKKSDRWGTWLVIGMLCLLMGGCGIHEEAEDMLAPDGRPKLQMVATIFPPYDFARLIGGEYVEVTQLLKPGMEAHSYEPSPRDVIRIMESDLFLYAGGESDVWVEKLLEGAEGDTVACSLLDWVEPLEEETPEGMQTAGYHHVHAGEEDAVLHGEDHFHGGVRLEGEYDEHVWTAPANAILLVERIRDEMIALDPSRKDIYAQNAEEYLCKLQELERKYEDTLGSVQRKVLIFADRFPFLYLVRSYGLDYYAAFPGCSPETEPSAATIAFLTDKVVEEKIPVIFYLESSDGKIAEAIGEVTGARTQILHSCHTLTRKEEAEGESYLSLMERNLEVLEDALNGRGPTR